MPTGLSSKKLKSFVLIAFDSAFVSSLEWFKSCLHSYFKFPGMVHYSGDHRGKTLLGPGLGPSSSPFSSAGGWGRGVMSLLLNKSAGRSVQMIWTSICILFSCENTARASERPTEQGQRKCKHKHFPAKVSYKCWMSCLYHELFWAVCRLTVWGIHSSIHKL